MSSGDRPEFGTTYILDETAITKASTLEELAEKAMRESVPLSSEEASGKEPRADRTFQVKSDGD